jgi:tripartite-type tricarboxylate transporter receptor subunit TctC
MQATKPQEATMHKMVFGTLLWSLISVGSVSAAESPIRILVGFPPGGGADTVARLVANKLKDSVNSTVIVENRPGASGQIAARELKAAAPDGKTLMIAPVAATVIAPLTHPKLDYDPARDFAPVCLAAGFQLALITGPGTPATSFPEYVSWVKGDAKRANFGITVMGSPPHFFGLLIGKAIGVEMRPVPYKGGAPLMNDLAGGHVPAAIALIPEAIGMHRTGRLKILASSGASRSPLAPEVPTFSELGFPQVQGDGVLAFYTVAGTPKVMVEQLAAAISGALRSRDVRAQLVAIGYEPLGSTPDEFARRIAEETAKWTPVVKASGYQSD